MTQLNLFLGLLEIVTQLLEIGADSATTYEARQLIDSLVEDFEESKSDEIEQSPLVLMLTKIATKETTMPLELKKYFLVRECFQVVENSQLEPEIFLDFLPLPEESIPYLDKLRIGAFIILNDLLKVDVTSCSVHKAHMELDAILAEHEQVQANIEEGFMVDSCLDQLFPTTMSALDMLRIIPESEVGFNAIV